VSTGSLEVESGKDSLRAFSGVNRGMRVRRMLDPL
jgi:hypothetical protein